MVYNKFLVVILLFLCVNDGHFQKIDSREVKCLVCQATVREMEAKIKQIDPKKTIKVGNYRLDSTGDSPSKQVSYAKSEMYLTELMETICDRMEDYAKARYKDSGKLTILKMIVEGGGMNPEMSAVDFVQDGDLNKSLQHFCLEVLEDNEEHVLKLFSEDDVKDVDVKLCTELAGYCNNSPTSPEDDYELEANEDKDEL